MQCSNDAPPLVITGLDIRNRLEAACSQKQQGKVSMSIENEYDYIKYIQPMNSIKSTKCQDNMVPDETCSVTGDDELHMPSVYDGLSSDEECYDKHNENIDNTIKDMQHVLTNCVDDDGENIWVKSSQNTPGPRFSNPPTSSNPLTSSNCEIHSQNPAFRDFAVCGGQQLVDSLSRCNGGAAVMPSATTTTGALTATAAPTTTTTTTDAAAGAATGEAACQQHPTANHGPPRNGVNLGPTLPGAPPQSDGSSSSSSANLATSADPVPPNSVVSCSPLDGRAYPGRIDVHRVYSSESGPADAEKVGGADHAPVAANHAPATRSASYNNGNNTATLHREVIDNHSYFKEEDCTSIPKYKKRQYSGNLYKSTSAEQDCYSCHDSDSSDSDSTNDEKPVTRRHGNTYNAVSRDDDDPHPPHHHDPHHPHQHDDQLAHRLDPRVAGVQASSGGCRSPPSPQSPGGVDFAYYKSVSDQFHGGCSDDIASRLAQHVAQNTYITKNEDEPGKETEDLLENKKSDDNSQRDQNCMKEKPKSERRKHKNREESVLIEGVLFRADYLGSTQLISDGRPSKAMRMMQAQEAVGRIKACDNEHQPSTEVDLFISIEKIMILNTDLQEVMMDHALRTISYIADIGETLVIMARRGPVVSTGADGKLHSKPQSKICCHVFQSSEAQLIAQSIGEAFQVAYSEFLRANGIDDPSLQGRHVDYQEVLNQQVIFGDELNLFSGKQKEVSILKCKGESLGVVVVESGWGSMVPTVVLANMAPGGVAAKCRDLNIGDQIMSVNGVSLVGLPLTSCENYIKASKTQTLVRLSTISCAPVVEVIIKRPDIKYQLGFSVQNGVICSLLRGGIAERGGVRVGHRIIDINNHSVVAVAHEKIVTLLATSIGEIHMKTMPTSIFRLLTGQDIPHYI